MTQESLALSHIQKMDERRQELLVPEFPHHLNWLNSAPLDFQGVLKGKIVVLDFWTYCCINCMHVLPELASLEEKYANDPVVFIGVHCAKFSNEKNSENIRQAILRYDVRHPVVNDANMEYWQQLGVHSWPTFVVIGPFGNLIYSVSGEGHKNSLDAIIEAALRFYHLFLKKEKVPQPLEIEREPISLLKFPGKLAVDPVSKHLFISDSNHHRILVTSLEGHVIETIGKGKAGFKDGPFHEAEFNRLQGLAFDKNKLFVADAENHALREVNFSKRFVRTLAGNGLQGRDYQGGKKGTLQELSTPWDLAISLDGNKIYMAMAGTHQIWVYDRLTEISSPLSGSGAEQKLDHKRLLSAGWAQPSGITCGENVLYIADSESSSIRAIDLIHQRASTLAGGDPLNPSNLFNFGDKDGPGVSALLQHPLGVIWWEKRKTVIVADTYNHRLKLLDPETRVIKAWIGSGERGFTDGKGLNCTFYEPSGFAWHPDGKTLFVADTNNHAIRLVNTETEEVKTLSIA